MASRAPKPMTIAEFLAWDDGTDRRYELVDGLPVMMASATEAHGEIAVNLGAEIRLGCCATPIPLDAVYRDLLAPAEAEDAGPS